MSIAAHGHDVFKTPRSLPRKLAAASFVAAPCEYTASHLKALCPEARVEVVVMGVDGREFVRMRPYPGTRRVLAIGRLVEKKGFPYLVRAAAALERSDPLDEVVIVGEGPVREELEELIAEHGMGHRVKLAGALSHEEVRTRLDAADLLCAPCVVAGDGDRDAMPVVVKEALACEVPVVASDEVGLPEVVRDQWGALVPPKDADALASALASLLERSPADRAAMGAAGRAFVLEKFDIEGEALHLLQLIDETDR